MYGELVTLMNGGFRVHPVSGGKSKAALLSNWQEIATNEPTQVKEWMHRYPNCKWGVVADDLVIIDLDIERDENTGEIVTNGVEEWERLTAENPTPATPVVRTPRGGIHLYFQKNGKELKNSTSSLARGIDVKTGNGYVIAPPSKGYTWVKSVDDFPIPVIPEWLEETLAEPESKSIKRGRISRETIPSGERNDTLFRFGSSLQARGYSDHKIYRKIYKMNQEQCEPPLPEWEIEAIFKSVRDYEKGPSRAHSIDRNPEDFTDVGNGLRFARENRNRVRYAIGLGWLSYQGGQWKTGANLEAIRIAQETAQGLYELAASASDPTEAKAWGQWAQKSLSQRAINATLEMAKPHLEVKVSDLDAHPELLNVRNGILDLARGELLPHSPEWLLTQQTNVEYDPEAQCPKWLDALDMIFEGNDEMIRYLQMCLGWSIGGRSDIKALFFMYGPSGNNGKSTITETMIELLGDYALKTESDSVMVKHYGAVNSPFIVKFRGRRFVVASETESKQKWSTKLVKDLTGNDTITAAAKYEAPIQFKPTHKLWVYGNERPEVDDTGDAFWSRMKTIPFKYKIPREKRRKMAAVINEFMTEGPGILNWLLEGYQLAAAGEIQRQEPEAVSETVHEYRVESDPLEQFIIEHCETGDGHKEDKIAFRQNFNYWIREQGLDSWTANALTREMKKKAFAIGGKGRRFYMKVSLNIPETLEPESGFRGFSSRGARPK